MDLEHREITAHPHRSIGKVPVQLPKATLLSLSAIHTKRALLAVVEEWLIIACAIWLSVTANHWAITLLAILIIGARQHALAILAHDAAHYRFLPTRFLNDWIGNLFLAWPVFISLSLFRSFHGPHHRFTGDKTDGNRVFWRSHDKSGNLTKDWRYPMSVTDFVLILLKKGAIVQGVLWIAGGTGLLWIFRGFPSRVVLRQLWPKMLCRFGYYAVLAGGIIALGIEKEALLYWLIPYCTWHIVAQYIRVICEHSGKISDRTEFAWTRSTLPGWLGRTFILPRNVGYHIEHHWYPSVPWYSLPALHQELLRDATFSAYANVQHSIGASLRQCLTGHDTLAGNATKG
jgi:fatty acid desaturase